jgi:anti-sigma factor RsiW
MTESCAHPIPWATLVDYWAGDLDEAETAAIDEHIFGCAVCSATSARVAAVTEAVREALPPVVSRARVDKLRASGLRVRENAFLPGVRSEVDFTSDTDLLIHRLEGLALADAARVDVSITSESTGQEISALDAVPFDAATGTVLVACQRHYAALPHDTVMTVSIHAPSAPARTARTARYTILHRWELR